MPTLDDLRNDIDRVDEVLVRLLNERARVACEIGRLKKEQGIPIYQPEREKQVLDHVRNVAVEGPLGAEAIARLFERIIDEARRLERRVIHDSPEPLRPFDAAQGRPEPVEGRGADAPSNSAGSVGSGAVDTGEQVPGRRK